MGKDKAKDPLGWINVFLPGLFPLLLLCVFVFFVDCYVSCLQARSQRAADCATLPQELVGRMGDDSCQEWVSLFL